VLNSHGCGENSKIDYSGRAVFLLGQILLALIILANKRLRRTWNYRCCLLAGLILLAYLSFCA
jgi:hypothetical protein